MAGQAAQMSRKEVTAMMNKADMSKQKKTASGGDPVMNANMYGNPMLKADGSTLAKKNKQIKITGYCK